MKKFEYKSDNIKNYIGGINHQQLLSKRGSDGWELVSVVMIKVNNSDRMRLYWKREVN